MDGVHVPMEVNVITFLLCYMHHTPSTSKDSINQHKTIIEGVYTLINEYFTIAQICDNAYLHYWHSTFVHVIM